MASLILGLRPEARRRQRIGGCEGERLEVRGDRRFGHAEPRDQVRELVAQRVRDDVARQVEVALVPLQPLGRAQEVRVPG